jgi:hypothetical protein
MWSHSVSKWDVDTQLGHREGATTETYTTFDPEYLKRAAETLDELVRGVCVPQPERRVLQSARRIKYFRELSGAAGQD